MFRLRDPQPVAATLGTSSWANRMIQDSTFPLSGQTNLDDLPRTLRREHEARAREARERDGPSLGTPSHASTAPAVTAPQAPDMTYMATETYAAPQGSIVAAGNVPAVVKAVDVPFGDLVAFFLKAVVAAVPAMLLMMIMLWGIGQIIEIVAPHLLKMKILISFPNS